MPQVQINVNTLINEFFNLFFQGLVVKVMIKTFTKEEAEKELEEVNEMTLKMFDGFLKPIQMQDLGAYLEIKKNIQIAFDQVKSNILGAYDPVNNVEVEEPKQESKIITEP